MTSEDRPKLAPEDVHDVVEDGSNSVFTNTCPIDQDTCANPTVLQAYYIKDGEKNNIDGITALNLIEKEHVENLKNEINQNLKRKLQDIINDGNNQISQADRRWLSDKESLWGIDNFIGIDGEYVDKTYIYSKAVARAYVLLGEAKFAQFFPKAYMWFGGQLDNIGQFIGEKVSAGDDKLYELFGEAYTSFKGKVNAFSTEIDNNAPEPVQDFIKLVTFGAIGKGAVLAGEKVVAGNIAVGGKLKDGAKKVFDKADDVIKPNTPPATGFKSKTSVGGGNSILGKYFGGEIKLKEHEGFAHGGHTKDLHVGLSEKKLKERIANEGKELVTTYPNEKVAESVISEVLSKSKNVNKIEKWLENNTKPKL